MIEDNTLQITEYPSALLTGKALAELAEFAGNREFDLARSDGNALPSTPPAGNTPVERFIDYVSGWKSEYVGGDFAILVASRDATSFWMDSVRRDTAPDADCSL